MFTIKMTAAIGGLALGVSVMMALIYYVVLKPSWRALEAAVDTYKAMQERADGLDD